MVGDFLGAYFNIYYNARKTFGEAEVEVWSQPDLRLQGAGRNYLTQFNVSQATKGKFASVIEKCSKLLEYHPESNLVDDALMMIGKSYFYQNDYQPAERKFTELITGYPQSDLLPEAKMLMAYSYFKEGNRTSASATATEVLEEAKKDEDDNIIAYASILLGQMDLEDKNYSQALEHYRDAANSGKTSDQRAFALLNVAEMYIKTGDFAKAEAAFGEERRQSSNYLGEYKGDIGVARMLAKQGKFDESLDLLNDLRSDLKYKEFFGEIELEIANVYRDQGKLSAAVEQYRYVDTAYARTEWSANSYYQLGLVYETVVGLYDSARIAYNKGKSEASAAIPVIPLLSRRADYMNKYASFTAEVLKMDSLRNYWLHPPDTTSAVHADTVARDTAQLKVTAVADSGKPKVPPKPPLPLDSVLTRLAVAKSELATLFYTSIGRTDSALFWYHRLIQDHPLSPLVPRALFSIAQIYSQDSTVSKTVVDSLYRQIMEQYPQSTYAAEARRALGLAVVAVFPDTAEALYHLAEEAMLAGRNENAIDTLKLIVQSFPTSSFAPRADYAAGWLYEQVLNQPDSAIAAYQRLRARYPSSMYTTRVQPKLVEVELRNKALADSAAQRKKALADSTGQKNKAVVDSTGQMNKVMADSSAQKKTPAAAVSQKKATEDEGPINKPPEVSPAGRDSTLAPRTRTPGKSQTGGKVPPTSNPAEPY
jgi:TolA-binding protein